MKIVVVVHRFPPKHQTGAELYSYRLARALARRHDVIVFTADDDLMHRNYSRRVFPLDGMRVVQITNHRKYDEFEHSYADPKMEKLFRELVQEEEPDIAHFQHLLHHSTGYAEIARSLGVPSVLTLHEYWLLCGRNGQLYQRDGTRCLGPALDKCSQCMSHFMWGRKGFDVWMLRGLESVKKLTGVDLKGRAREIRLRKFSDASAELSDQVVSAMKANLLFREARIRDLFDMVDVFVAPSRFLRERFIEFGLPAERILSSDYGTQTDEFDDLEPAPRGDRLRIGFVGSIQPVKGVHVLLQALQDLDASRYEARIFGDLSTKPEYTKALERQMSDAVRLMDRVEASEIPRVMAGFDVLVVPSLWWENSPLVIHEAFAAGVPVVCSGIGGMKELVEDGVSGLHFEPGNPNDLAARLRSLADDAGRLEELRRGIPRLKTIDEDADFHNNLYEAVTQHHAEMKADVEHDH